MQYLRQCYPMVDRVGVRGTEKDTFDVSYEHQLFRALFVTRLFLLLIARLLHCPNNVVMREIILALWRVAGIPMESLVDKNDSLRQQFLEDFVCYKRLRMLLIIGRINERKKKKERIKERRGNPYVISRDDIGGSRTTSCSRLNLQRIIYGLSST